MEFCEFCQNIPKTFFTESGDLEYKKLEPFSATVSRCRLCELIYPLIDPSGGHKDDREVLFALLEEESTYMKHTENNYLANPVGFIYIVSAIGNSIRLAIWCDEGKQGPLTQLVFLFLTLSGTMNRKSYLKAT